MYSLAGYGEMIADRVRVDAYAQALRNTVRPGAVVLDIGTGPGFWAVLACELGASRVYAIEPSDIIQVAREIAAKNRCADRIVFIEEMSTKVTLPERADVIVSDLRGVLPLFQRHIPSILDARLRLLAPGGVLIPRKDTVWAAIAEAPEVYRGLVEPWEQNCLHQNLLSARQLIVNNPLKVRLDPKQLLTATRPWASLDYRTIENPDVRGKLQWTVERAGTGHGVVVWFDTELTDGVGFSNVPGAPKVIYGSFLFPWLQPVPLAAGQAVRVNLEAKLLAEEYIWRWTTRVDSSNQTPIEFDQSSFRGAILSPAKLHKAASDHVPQLSEEGLLDRRILELMDGRATLEEIACKLVLEFPHRFRPGRYRVLCQRNQQPARAGHGVRHSLHGKPGLLVQRILLAHKIVGLQ